MSSQIDIDVKVRCIVLYQDAKWSADRIADKLKKPNRTIRDWVEKLEKGINILERKKGQGRKSAVTQETKERIVREVRRKPASSSTRNLGAHNNMSKNTAYLILKEKDFTFGSTDTKTTLDQQQKNKRVKYCKNMLKRKGAPIDEIFFSDEMGINLSDTLTTKAWSGPRKKIKVEKLLSDPRVSCWGAISRYGATSLEIYEGTLNSERYEGIVQNHQDEMIQIFPEGFKFMHDNLPLHKAAEGFLASDNFEIIEFPEYSPDLTPIENLWGTLKKKVKQDAPKTKRQLINSLKKNWEVLTEVDNLKPYFENLHDRYRECIDKKGIRLPY